MYMGQLSSPAHAGLWERGAGRGKSAWHRAIWLDAQRATPSSWVYEGCSAVPWEPTLLAFSFLEVFSKDNSLGDVDLTMR